MANSNRQTDNRKAKLKRRRHQVDRAIAHLQTPKAAGQEQGGQPVNNNRAIRTLKTAMRYWGGD